MITTSAYPFIRHFLMLFLLGILYPGRTQNLVPNHSFESISTCPTAYGGLCAGMAPPWQCATDGSADLFNACGNPSMVGVPDNMVGYQEAFAGVGYGGFLAKYPSPEYREYLMAELLEPMVAGTWYYICFYISLAETGCGVEHIGAYFSVNNPYTGGFTPLNVVPQVETSGGFISDYENWVLVAGSFQAAGGESYITIGNFRYDSETPMDPTCNLTYSYYFLDEISVTSVAPEEVQLELGGPVFECFTYEIDPGNDGAVFTWSDGSTDPTLVVTESGTYAVTVSSGCAFAIDSIEVTIGGVYDPVDLGPDEVTICSGTEYNIALDPDLSDYEWNDGSTDPEFTITTAGMYSVTLDDGCLSTTDQINVIVMDPPSPFSLGEDMELCVGEEFTLSLDPTLGDFIWQDNSTSSSYVVSDDGTYSVTISNMCGMVSDEIYIADLEVPEVEIGPDELNICEGELIDIEIEFDNVTIVWQDGSDLPNYEITTAGTYTVWVTNMCGTGSDEMVVSVTEPPALEFGPDINLCEGETITLTAPAFEGTYQWQDNSTSTEYQVTSPGVYSLLMINFCGEAYDDVVVNYESDVDPPNFGPDVSLCPGEEVILYANNPSATNIVWQDNSTADSLLVNSSGTYFVEVSNSCSVAADTINVTVNDSPPQVDLPAQLSLCQGESLTLDAAIQGVSYLWNDNSQNQQLLITSAGVYSLTVTNACGTDIDSTIVLDGGLAPAVSLGNDLQLCPGEIVDLTPTFANVDSWLWQDGSTMPTYTVANAGVITVEVNNSCGAAFDTLMVDVLPSTPPLDLGSDTSLCSGASFTLTINTTGVSILWPDGSSDPDFLVNGPGTIYAAISNSCGQSLDTIQVSALPDIPLLNLGPDQSLCPGEIITIDPGIPDVAYEWHDGSTNNTYQSTAQETIMLTITNDCGSSSDELEIIENSEGPQVDLGEDIQVCEGITVTIPAGISGVDYLWQDGSTDAQFVTSQSGIFILNVSNNCGTDADTIAVDISGIAPNPVLGNDTTLCEGLTITLTSLADAETSILWQDGSNANVYIVSTPGTFILNESNRCGDAADSMVVNYLDAPDPFNLGRDTTLCPGESIVLTAPTTAFDIQWQDGSNQQSIIADEAITYSLQLSNECGMVSDNLVVTIDTRIPILDLGTPPLWCEGDVITLDATQAFNAAYLWNTGAITSSVQLSTPGVYSVEVATLCSTVSSQVEIIPSTDCFVPEVFDEIYIPNVFSPDNDQINDVFTVSYGPDLDVTGMEGSIFDRWGNLVYQSTMIPFAWDGRYNDDHVLPGVYVYLIKCTYLLSGQEKLKILSGDITVIR